MPNQTKHIILGAGGAIASTLTKVLLSNDEKVKLVSRSGHSVDGAESVQGDMLNSDSVKRVVEPSAVVYLLVGLPYNSSVWRQQWPVIMNNTIEACKKNNSRLIFFDNVYLYGRVDGAMTEETPINPCSKKGEVRAQIAASLMDQAKRGDIDACIARAADFYGPYADKVSIPYIFYFSRLAANKPAQPLVNTHTKHSYTYTEDCGKALYLLAKSDNISGQVWHLPTASPALTDEQFIRVTADKLNVRPDYRILRKWMIKLAGFFDRQTREVYELIYQNEFDYVFDSTRFEQHFNLKPTPYETGIDRTLTFFKLKS